MTSWPPDRTELLKKLWAEGLSASQIGAELGGISRSAVMGKKNRLNLSARPDRATNQTKSKKPSPLMADNLGFARFKSRDPKPPPSLPKERDTPAEIAPLDTRCSILDLSDSTCRWPIGDSRKPLDPIFCGGKTIEGLCYCEYHVRLAYRPAQQEHRRSVSAG